ncbi:hypothetical protein V1512DRAFT_258859 [Lipomyces arxii]|uniref:uncharacterized protein n=1 Tax=Lipomyces arxii TaxID=56418 RepID=UPI0034CE16EA
MPRLGRKYSKLATTNTQADSASTEIVPKSPPPSFRSTASYMPILPDDPLARSFDVPESDGELDDDNHDDFVYHHDATTTTTANNEQTQSEEDSRLLATLAPSSLASSSSSSSSVSASTSASASHQHSAPSNSNDGVFANIMAKPEAAREKPAEENPPSYEEAAADATPPYWETTILAPGMTGDEIYIDGLPVGNFFNFVWNMLISMSFQFIGFLLTYLLHTTHAAKNGSRAGLGITLIQYGFYLRYPQQEETGVGSGVDAAAAAASAAADPNSYMVQSSNDTNPSDTAGQQSDDSHLFSFLLMWIGWFILIKSLYNFFRARRMEQAILRGPTPTTRPAQTV